MNYDVFFRNTEYFFQLFLHSYLLQNLPKVPVPDLDQTMNEYVRIMEPVLTKQQHDRLKAITKEFESGEGQALQHHLYERRDYEDNWVISINKKWWLFEWLSSFFTFIYLPN